MNKKEPLTIDGRNKIQSELDNLIKNDREQIKVKIQEARELGDLKENAEYHAAKEKQAHIEGRILQLQGILSNCEVIEVNKASAPNNIVFGATVTLFDPESTASASVKAMKNASTLKITPESYKAFCKTHPAQALELVSALAKGLASRLRAANEKVL